MKKKLGLTAVVGCLALGALGAGASPASAVTVQAEVGLNSPNGSKTVVLPDAATSGVINAFTNVITKGPGDLSNIDVNVGP